jgi:hypothetical protein
MGMLGGILSILAALCGVMGIIVATEAIVLTSAGVDDWMFWFGLSAILFIATIAVGVGRSE